MANSFQKEIPRSRINITLDVDTGNNTAKKELPLKLLILGDFSHGQNQKAIAERERIPISKYNFDEVMARFSPRLHLNLASFLNAKQNKISMDFKFQSRKDFHPHNIVRQSPELSKLLAMRNLLRELKASLIDNKPFRYALEDVVCSNNNLQQLKDEIQLRQGAKE